MVRMLLKRLILCYAVNVKCSRFQSSGFAGNISKAPEIGYPESNLMKAATDMAVCLYKLDFTCIYLYTVAYLCSINIFDMKSFGGLLRE